MASKWISSFLISVTVMQAPSIEMDAPRFRPKMKSWEGFMANVFRAPF